MRVLQFLLVVLLLAGTVSGEEQQPPTPRSDAAEERLNEKRKELERLKQEIERDRLRNSPAKLLYCEAFRNGRWVPVECLFSAER